MMRQPPRFALALLNRVGSNNEALTGDLLESYAAGRSRTWLWTQLLVAVARGAFRSSGEIRPLRLVENPSWQPPIEDFSEQRKRLNLLLGASPVRGAGGLSIVALIVLTSIVQPALWLLMVIGLLGGIAAGVIRVAIRRRAQPGAGFTTLLPGRGGRW